jgi:methionyl-tRNA formyltransferase
MRVVLFAPTSRSLYSRLVAHALIQEPGVDLVGIFVRRLWSYKRIRTDLGREGPRLLQKILTKLILTEVATADQAPSPIAVLADERGLDFNDLSRFCQRHGIAYRKLFDFNAPNSAVLLRALSPDLVVFTGGGLIRMNILQIPSLGVLNCHSGLLPRYRGMDTLEWTVLEPQGARPQVGLSLHYMDAGVDTGPILSRHVEELRPGDSLDAIRKRLEPAMVRLIVAGVHDLLGGELRSEPQERSAGRQYFVIHPRLQARAEYMLSQAWGKARGE